MVHYSHSLTDKTIVIDLDSTLLYTPSSDEGSSYVKTLKNPLYHNLKNRVYHFTLYHSDKIGRGKNEDYWGVVRPGTYEFLEFCFRYFRNVIIWSAGTEDYVRNIVKYIFRNLPYPDDVLSRKFTNFVERNKINVTEKPLQKIYDLYASDKNIVGVRPEKTLIVDDTKSTFFHNQENAIHIPDYTPNMNDILEAEDDCLYRIIDWLETKEVVNAKDVRLITKPQF